MHLIMRETIIMRLGVKMKMCEMKMTTLPEPSSYTTSDPAASAWSRHTWVDFMMRPCALNTLKGITSMGVVCSNCCPNCSAVFVGASWAALAFANCRANSAAAVLLKQAG